MDMNTTPHIMLVVEDEHTMAQALFEKFISVGYNVLKAADGEEGLHIALERHPDIIILDLLMPKMDGILMLQKLRDDTWGSTAKVIVLTNLDDEKKIAQAFDLGVHDYYAKADSTLASIVERVQELLRPAAV